MEEEKFNNIKQFLNLYENTLKNIYFQGLKDLGKGLLCININNNNNGNCDTQYLSLNNIVNEELKNRINSNNKIFYSLIDNDINVIIERNIL